MQLKMNVLYVCIECELMLSMILREAVADAKVDLASIANHATSLPGLTLAAANNAISFVRGMNRKVISS